MRVLVRCSLALVSAAAFASPAAAYDSVPGRVVVGFTASADAGSRAASRHAAGGRLVRRLALGRRGGVQVLNVGRGHGRVRRAVRALSGRRGVRFAEPEYVGRVAGVTPDDTDYLAKQWNLPLIGMPAAWEVTTGSAAVKLAVLDTGIDLDHPELAGQIDAADGHDYVDGDATPDDPTDATDALGHGTHVAGIAGALGGNGAGVAGVSWSSSLVALRVCGTTGACTAPAIASAIAHARDVGARVANLSIDSLGPSQAVKDALAAAPETLFVAAAGNGNPGHDLDEGDPDYPCAFPAPNLVCVAASRSDDTLLTSSNFGTTSVDLTAPGNAIWSTVTGGGYGEKTGTSMAAPHVAGAAALLWANAPSASVADVRNALLSSVAESNLPVATGGRLDVAGALDELPDVVIEGPAEGTASPVDQIPFRATPAGTGFVCRLDDEVSFTPCSSPYDASGAAEGPHTLHVRAVTGGITASRSWTLDRIAPEVTVDAPTEPPLRRPPVRFSVDDATAATLCSLDGADFVPCASPFVPEAPLADGSHALVVRAMDAAGNAGADTVTWDVVAAPATTLDVRPNAQSNEPSPAFAFSATGATGFRCSLDGAGFAPCASPMTVPTLADGPHELRVGATADGFPDDQEWTTWAWTVDTVAPAVSIIGGPTGQIASRSASVPFTVGEGLPAQCAVDGGSPGACTSPFTVAGLPDGSHTVTVAAQDAAGNVGEARRSWAIDATAPAVAIDGVSAAEGTASIAFHADDGALTTCALDGAPAAACTSQVTYGGLADGRHTFVVRAADALGNTSAVSTGFDMTHTPAATPTLTATATPAPAAAAAVPTAVARAVADRLRGHTPAQLARLKSFRVRYAAALGGTLTVRVRLAAVGTVLEGRSVTTRARTLRPRVARTAAAKRLARRTRATLTITASFDPARGRTVRATRQVIARRR